MLPSLFEEWLDGLRPFDVRRDLDALVALASEAHEDEAWGLLLEEGGRLLLRAHLPATTLMFENAIRRATNSRTEAPSTSKALEQVFRRAFTADGGGQVPDEQSARVTFRLAATLRHLCDDLLDGRDPSERVLCSLAGLEVLMREHEPNSSRNNAVALLCDRLAPRFPAIVTELESYWTARSEAEITASQVELERWQTELYRLCSDIGESLAVRHSRGLILLSRIQMDNNQKVFRPLVDSLLSTDRLSEEHARTIQRLDATVLLDRHPLQVAAAATRKIAGAARNDTIRDYESLIVKMNQALTLRMKLHGQTQKRAEAAELRAQLDRYAQHMQATSDEPGEWLLTRLLRREAVPVATLPWAPDSSVVAHPAATSVRVALLYAVAEPHILERTPERVVALGDPVGAFGPLLLAAARREGVAPRAADQVITDLVAADHHIVARIWANVADRSADDRVRLGADSEQRLNRDRRILRERLDAAEKAWPQDADSTTHRRFAESIQRARSSAEIGLLAVSREHLQQAEQLLVEQVESARVEGPGAPLAPPRIEVEHSPPPPPPRSSVGSASPTTHHSRIDLDQMFRDAEQARIRQDLEWAERCFREILQDDPTHHRARSQLAVLLQGRKRLEEAVELLKAGLELRPRHLPFLSQLSMMCRALGRLEDAGYFAEAGLSYCENPDQELGFLSELILIERRRGNAALAIEYWRRLPERQQRNPPFQPEAKAAQYSAADSSRWETGDLEPPAEDAELPYPELYPEHLEISEFLGEDLRREHTRVEPAVLDSDGPEKVSEFAVRIAHEAISMRRKVAAERAAELAETLRTSIKLLTEIDERRPDFNYVQYITGIDQGGGRVRRDHKSTLRRYLSYYSSYMGDYHRRYGRVDTARAYYLEHFRVIGTLPSFSILSGEKFILTWHESNAAFRKQAHAIMRQLYDSSNAVERPGEELLIQFQVAIERLCLGPQPISDWQGFLWAFIDICRVNPTARETLLRCSERAQHPVCRLIRRLQSSGWHTGVSESHSTEWVHKVLQVRDDVQLKTAHELQYLREQLLGAEKYEQASTLIAQVHERLRGIDARHAERVQSLIRSAERYRTAPRFEEKALLASSIQLDARMIQASVEAEPTEIGRLHLVKILFRLSRDIEMSFEKFKQRSLPSLHLQMLKSSRSGVAARCDLQIENQGLAPASNILLQFFLADGAREVGRMRVDALAPRQLYAAVEKLVLDLSGLAATEAADVRVTGTLQDADGNELPLPPTLLRVAAASDHVFCPITNVFRTGRPVHDESMFKGRDRLVEEILAEVGNPVAPAAVVMFGQRRSGKSSILYWIAKKAPDWLVPVQFDFNAAFADTQALPVMLCLIAEKIADDAQLYRRQTLPRIDDEALLKTAMPTLAFRRYLQQVSEALGPERRLLVLFDEFTDLTARIDAGVIERGFLRYLKSVIEEGLFSCVICGIDSMPRVLKGYSNDFAIANTRLVSYLDRESALQLIESPIPLPDQSSRFTPGAAQEIVDLTAGFPYYIQLLCHRLVEYLNRERNPDPAVTRADVEQATREVIQGKVPLYPWTTFDNLCRYKEAPEFDTRSTVLEGFLLFLIADEMRTAQYASLADLVRRIGGAAREDEIEDALNDLVDREVLVMLSGSTVRQFRIKVLLFYRWIVANRVMDHAAAAGFRRRLSLFQVSAQAKDTQS